MSTIGGGMAAASKRLRDRNSVSIFAARIEDELEKGLFDDAIAAVKAGLVATRTVRYRIDGGGIGYREVPDAPIQLAAAITVLQYALGKPVNRTEMVLKNEHASPVERARAAAEAMLSDPKTFIGVLDDWKTIAESAKSGAAKRVEVIDVDSA